MDHVEEIYYRNGTVIWKEHETCAGFVVSDSNCPLRHNEMELVSYTPIQC